MNRLSEWMQKDTKLKRLMGNVKSKTLINNSKRSEEHGEIKNKENANHRHIWSEGKRKNKERMAFDGHIKRMKSERISNRFLLIEENNTSALYLNLLGSKKFIKA